MKSLANVDDRRPLFHPGASKKAIAESLKNIARRRRARLKKQRAVAAVSNPFSALQESADPLAGLHPAPDRLGEMIDQQAPDSHEDVPNDHPPKASPNDTPPSTPPQPIPDPSRAPPSPAAANSPETAKKPRGAPRIFDQNLREVYCELLKRGFAKGDAARLLGITRETVNRARHDPKFDRDVRAAVLDCRSRAAAQIVRAGDTHWRAAAWLLAGGAKKRSPGRPRELRSLLLDNGVHTQIKNLIYAALDELLPSDSIGLAGAIQTALANPNYAMMHLFDTRERIIAKTMTVIKSLVAAEAASAHRLTHQNNTRAQNVR
jgi:hypothetical protein